MVMRCSRVGCGGIAVASFCFDARATLVWLDSLDPERGLGAGVLCAEHADALTPPRGWYLRDRRHRAPRLWDDRPPPAAPSWDRSTRRASAAPPTPPTGRAPERTLGGAPVEPLPLHPADAASRRILDIEHALAAGGRGLLARAFSRVTGARPAAAS